ncbi:MAG: hypothetical protein Ta2F_12100 [Termitinemataceae bacterium]|nr:MAG: hypothetical protein Ta2F_12100 [Termitinemataceae bacterium]
MLGGIFSTSYARASLNNSQAGKLAVPVSQGSYIYSQFKHVSGVVAPEGVNGAPVSKLKILDSIIDRLIQMRKNNDTVTSINQNADKSDAMLDVLIEQFQSQIKQVSAASAAMPYIPSPAIAAGSFVNITF